MPVRSLPTSVHISPDWPAATQPQETTRPPKQEQPASALPAANRKTPAWIAAIRGAAGKSSAKSFSAPARSPQELLSQLHARMAGGKVRQSKSIPDGDDERSIRWVVPGQEAAVTVVARYVKDSNFKEVEFDSPIDGKRVVLKLVDSGAGGKVGIAREHAGLGGGVHREYSVAPGCLASLERQPEVSARLRECARQAGMEDDVAGFIETVVQPQNYVRPTRTNTDYAADQYAIYRANINGKLFQLAADVVDVTRENN